LPIQTWLAEDNRLHEEGLRTRIHEAANEAYQQKCETLGADIRVIERQVMLQVLDTLWTEHLSNMDHLRQGIGLRAYAQKNPRQEYKRESFELFQQMLESIKLDTVRFLSRVQVRSPEEVAAMEARQLEEQKRQQLQMQHEEVSALGGEAQPQQGNNPQPFVREGRKVGRNDPCPCGSGKKYKQCHGRLG
ncbi:SEC-C metal-binding domain-containing protein, partial [Porticoccus sp.]